MKQLYTFKYNGGFKEKKNEGFITFSLINSSLLLFNNMAHDIHFTNSVRSYAYSDPKFLLQIIYRLLLSILKAKYRGTESFFLINLSDLDQFTKICNMSKYLFHSIFTLHQIFEGYPFGFRSHFGLHTLWNVEHEYFHNMNIYI